MHEIYTITSNSASFTLKSVHRFFSNGCVRDPPSFLIASPEIGHDTKLNFRNRDISIVMAFQMSEI